MLCEHGIITVHLTKEGKPGKFKIDGKNPVDCYDFLKIYEMLPEYSEGSEVSNISIHSENSEPSDNSESSPINNFKEFEDKMKDIVKEKGIRGIVEYNREKAAKEQAEFRK